MPRAGFTAIWSGQISFGKDGRWYCDGEPIANAAIARLYSRTLTVEPDGRGRLVLGEDKAWVTIEDTPWVVSRIEGDPRGGFTLVLNDDSREPLEPESLRSGPDDVLYARAHGGHRVRFLRKAYYDLARHFEHDADGRVVLPVGDRRVPIGRAA